MDGARLALGKRCVCGEQLHPSLVVLEREMASALRDALTCAGC